MVTLVGWQETTELMVASLVGLQGTTELFVATLADCNGTTELILPFWNLYVGVVGLYTGLDKSLN